MWQSQTEVYATGGKLMLKEFKEFIARANIIDLAVAVIIGPVTNALGIEKAKFALQEASVVAFVKPRKV